MRRAVMITMVATLLVAFATADASAKPGRDAGAKMRGEFGNTAAARKVKSYARSYSNPTRTYNNYAQPAQSYAAKPRSTWQFWRI